jgi:hypothetical protein
MNSIADPVGETKMRATIARRLAEDQAGPRARA